MANISSGGCPPKDTAGSASGAAPQPAGFQPVSGAGIMGLPATSGLPAWNAPPVPKKPTNDDVQKALQSSVDSFTAASTSAGDCVCDALNRVASAMEKVRGFVFDAAERPLSGAQADYLKAVGLAAERAGADRTIAGLKAGSASAASGVLDGPAADPSLQDYVGAARLAGLGGGPATGIGKALDTLVPAGKDPGAGVKIGLGGGDTPPPPPPTRTPDLTPYPVGYPVPTPGKWSVWQDAPNCKALAVAPDAAPVDAGYAFVQAYDTVGEASSVAARLNAEAAACGALPEPFEQRVPSSPWDSDKACKEAALALASPEAGDEHTIARALGVRNKAGKPVEHKELKGFTIWGASVGLFVAFLLRLWADVFDGILAAFKLSVPAAGKASVTLSAKAAVGRFLEQKIGVSIPQAYRPAEYAARYLDPQTLPDAGTAAQLYGAGVIERETAECWGRAGDQLPGPFAKVLDAQHTIPSAEQTMFLRRSGTIGPTQAETFLKRNGWRSKGDVALLDKLTEAQPGVQDVIRFLVRDVGDADLVGRFGMDTDFDKKWAGPVADYAKNQAVPEGLAKLYWRAHWSIPSPTQLAEFYHRFRHGDAQGQNPLAIEDVTQALEQQDILPFWIPRFLEASFKPLTRADTLRAAELGVLNTDAVRRSYWAAGYSDADADTLTEYNARLVARRQLNDPGVKAYIRSETDWATAILGNPGLKPGTTPEIAVKALADRQRKIRRDGQCARGIRNRFMRGEFDVQDAADELASYGMDKQVAADNAGGWQCERKAADLKPTLAQLGRWYADGLINTGDYRSRLVRLGFTAGDANRVIATTYAAEQLKQEKAAEAALAKAKKAKAFAKSTSSQERKAQEAEVRRRNAELKAAVQAKEARQNRMRGAAGRLGKKRGVTMAAALADVLRAYDTALAIAGDGMEEAAARAAVIAADNWKDGSEDIWQGAAELVQPRSS